MKLAKYVGAQRSKAPAGVAKSVGGQRSKVLDVVAGILCGAPVAALLSFSRVQPQLLERLHAGPSLGGLLQAVAILTIVPGVWLMGHVERGIGSRHLIRTGVVSLGVVVALLPHLPGLAWTFVAAAVIGLLCARVEGPVRHLLAASVDDAADRKAQSALLTGSFALGVFGLLGVLTLLTGQFGLSIAMAVLGAVLVVLGIVVPARLPAAQVEDAEQRVSMRTVLGDPIARTAIAQYLIQGLAYGIWIGPLATLLAGHGHGPNTVALFGFDGLVSFVVFLVLDRLRRKISGRVATFGFLAGQIIAASSLFAGVPLVAVLLIGMVTEDVSTNALSSDCNDRMEGATAKSLGFSARQFGVAVGVYAGGSAYAAFSDIGIFASGIAVTAALCVPLALRMHRQHH
ncbi:hypothetical protein DSM104299_00501 [Baekduia alba]|uniref:MFS transporter n=1 Tax=Baekduia alba TaxID=2997333 RepID=UPI00233FB3B5|nr:MFS transporter [Baekduia alba]WCB91823.1 hypothetical protein DSM104299_00501 [Baekduia alba]